MLCQDYTLVSLLGLVDNGLNRDIFDRSCFDIIWIVIFGQSLYQEKFFIQQFPKLNSIILILNLLCEEDSWLRTFSLKTRQMKAESDSDAPSKYSLISCYLNRTWQLPWLCKVCDYLKITLCFRGVKTASSTWRQRCSICYHSAMRLITRSKPVPVTSRFDNSSKSWKRLQFLLAQGATSKS